MGASLGTSEDKKLGQLRDLVLDAIRESRKGYAGDIIIAENAAKTIIKRNQFSDVDENTSKDVSTTASYLRLIQSMLAATRNGVPRSRFLSLIFDALRGRGEVGNRTILLLEGYSSPISGELRSMKVAHYIGAREEHIRDFERNLEPGIEFRFVRDLVKSKRLLDFELSTVLSEYQERIFAPYKGDFSGLRKGRIWISSIPLVASEEGEPDRTLVGLYDVIGDAQEAAMPPGARQEWEILQLMPEIFDLLQHRVSTMKSKLDQDQELEIVNLAPGAITHELGTSIGIMEATLGRMPNMLMSLAEKVGEDDESLAELSDELVEIQRQLEISKETTEAFTNLERRNPRTKTKLETVIKEISVVLSRRLMLANTSISTDIPEGLEIETDVRYITHILMNVIINALEAIRPSDTEPKDKKKDTPNTIAVQARSVGDMIEIILANDGPEIPSDIVGRVFQKGITTKPHGIGHGQGLHLCRQIAIHLGGTFGFGSAPASLKDATVSFALTVPATVQFEADQ